MKEQMKAKSVEKSRKIIFGFQEVRRIGREPKSSTEMTLSLWKKHTNNES